MNELYKQYFQKSYTFLYPLLGFNGCNDILPIQTYIKSSDYFNIDNNVLICIYKYDESDKWTNFEKNRLITHKLLKTSILLKENKIAYVFDFSVPTLQKDFISFIKGKYSKFSKMAKKGLMIYYKKHPAEWKYIESFIYPEKYFDKYSELLNADIKTLKIIGELCDKLDIKKESTILDVINY